jgi:outer membrane PBP1 activator LpoA protein
MKFQWRLSLSAILLSTIISGCGVQSPSKPVISSAEQNQIKVTTLLTKAEKSKPIKSATLRAEAAQILLSLGEKDRAYKVLNDIDISLLSPTIRFDIAKLKVEAAIEQQNPDQALQHLSTFETVN